MTLKIVNFDIGMTPPKKKNPRTAPVLSPHSRIFTWTLRLGLVLLEFSFVLNAYFPFGGLENMSKLSYVYVHVLG